MKTVILGIVVGAVALCGGVRYGWAAAPAAQGVTVEIKSFAFGPAELQVAPGTTVTWINRDQTVHNIVSGQGKFASKGMDTDDRYSFTFEQAGDYSYLCALHPHMIGSVHVR